jgi:hypothetical protein
VPDGPAWTRTFLLIGLLDSAALEAELGEVGARKHGVRARQAVGCGRSGAHEPPR